MALPLLAAWSPTDHAMPTDLLPPLPADVQRHLRQLEDEDPMFADAMRLMLWDGYAQAGCPLGRDEHAMHAWWAFKTGTTVQ